MASEETMHNPENGHNRAELFERFIESCSIRSIDRSLLEVALTHRSYVFEMSKYELKDNERLEYLGDAVISTVVAEYLYMNFEEASEGELSKLRARIVSRAMLARRAKELNLGDLLLLGKGEEQTGGRSRTSIIGGALEAMVGAIYLSAGMDEAHAFILRYIVNPIKDTLEEEDYIDYKSRLQEYVQKRFQTIPEYRVINEQGPEHSKTFTLEVWINGTKMGTGTGKRKKIAENTAARQALTQLESTT